MAAESAEAIKIFYCYARRDTTLLNQLDGHLETMKQSGKITTWYDRDIVAGQSWKQEVEKHLNTSDILLLLITSHFLRSKRCHIEMHRALERHNRGETTAIPIILRPVDWEETLLGDLQALPSNGKPVSTWRDRDEAFLEVARGIMRVVNTLLSENQLPREPNDTLYDDYFYILIVDNDRFANTLIQYVLKKEGYEVETADNPRGAFQIIQRRKPGLLLLEVTLPYLNGFEFSAKLRAEGYKIPTIFLTAADGIEAKLQGFALGADDYVCKPYNHQELVARVRAVLRRIKNFEIGS